MLISWVYYFIVMIKTIINHYLFDMGLSIFFESVYTNMVIPRIVPVMNGQTMSIDGHHFKLVLFNLSGDTNECIKIGHTEKIWIIFRINILLLKIKNPLTFIQYYTILRSKDCIYG